MDAGKSQTGVSEREKKNQENVDMVQTTFMKSGLKWRRGVGLHRRGGNAEGSLCGCTVERGVCLSCPWGGPR